jgi:hypothetical protein
MTHLVRMVTRRDMEQVLEIERQCFDNAWTPGGFLKFMRRSDTVGLVAVGHDAEIVGFVLYERDGDCFRVVRIAEAVAERDDSCKVSHTIIQSVIARLTKKITRVRVVIRETQNREIKLFSEEGFFAEGVVRRPFDDDSGDDAYSMVFDPNRKPEPKSGTKPEPQQVFTNRISEYI